MQSSCFKLGISHQQVVATGSRQDGYVFRGPRPRGPTPCPASAALGGAGAFFISIASVATSSSLLLPPANLGTACAGGGAHARGGAGEGARRSDPRAPRAAAAPRGGDTHSCASGLPVMAQVDPREGVTAQGRLPGRPTPVRDSGTTVQPFLSGHFVPERFACESDSGPLVQVGRARSRGDGCLEGASRRWGSGFRFGATPEI